MLLVKPETTVYQDAAGQMSTDILSRISKYHVVLKYPKNFIHPRTFKRTLEFLRCSYDSEYIHVDLSVFGVTFSHPPSHPEEEVAGGEAVSTQRMTERILRSVTQLKPPVGVSEGL